VARRRESGRGPALVPCWSRKQGSIRGGGCPRSC
jgi:hypothetical protein